MSKVEEPRVDQGITPPSAQTHPITPDKSFTEGHGDPDDWPEDVKKERDEAIKARAEEVEAAVEADEEVAAEQRAAIEAAAEEYAKRTERAAAVQDAIAGLVTTASTPTSTRSAAKAKSGAAEA